VWSLPYRPHAQYAKFKGILYSFIDPRMGMFFPLTWRHASGSTRCFALVTGKARSCSCGENQFDDFAFRKKKVTNLV
jgi:hypothetical protein